LSWNTRRELDELCQEARGETHVCWEEEGHKYSTTFLSSTPSSTITARQNINSQLPDHSFHLLFISRTRPQQQAKMVSSKLLFIAFASILTSATAAPAEKRGDSSNGYSK
jgi:hypothetical protein